MPVPFRRFLGLMTRMRFFRVLPYRDIDGNVYRTVRIGSQIWTENIRTTHYSDGSPIQHVVSDVEWENTRDGAYCFHENTEDDYLKKKYGALYNWLVIYDNEASCATPRLAPEGWRVPHSYDWMALDNYLHDQHYYESFAGLPVYSLLAKSIASQTDWRSSNIEATPGYIEFYEQP